QLVDHDLPRLADAVEPLLGRRPKFAVLKGRHHYLCRARIDDSTAEEPDALFDAGGGGRQPVRWLGRARRLRTPVPPRRGWGPATGPGAAAALARGVDVAAGGRVARPAGGGGGAPRGRWGAACSAEASRGGAGEADMVVTTPTRRPVDMRADGHTTPPH